MALIEKIDSIESNIDSLVAEIALTEKEINEIDEAALSTVDEFEKYEEKKERVRRLKTILENFIATNLDDEIEMYNALLKMNQMSLTKKVDGVVTKYKKKMDKLASEYRDLIAKMRVEMFELKTENNENDKYQRDLYSKIRARDEVKGSGLKDPSLFLPLNEKINLVHNHFNDERSK
jgi:outer membrane murein-binding lipoprotein Lpp